MIDENCPCAGKSLPRLLRPGIMAFLAQGEAVLGWLNASLRLKAGENPIAGGTWWRT
jgi:hypothetical protein